MSIKAIEILSRREEMPKFIQLRNSALVQEARSHAAQVKKQNGWRLSYDVPEELETAIAGDELSIRVAKAREYAAQCQQKARGK